MIKLLRVGHIFFVTFVITLAAFAYRFMWYSTETVPEGRIVTAFVGAALFFFLSVGIEALISEIEKQKNEKNTKEN